MTAYSNTAPGAPMRADALPVKIIPNPSPNDQTPRDQSTDTTIAGLTVDLTISPSPTRSCMAANSAFQAAMLVPLCVNLS